MNDLTISEIKVITNTNPSLGGMMDQLTLG